MNNNEDMKNIIEISPPLRKPQSTPIDHGQCTFVYFDLETTGLGKCSHIDIEVVHGNEAFFSEL